MLEIYQKLVETLSRGGEAALVTVISSHNSTPRRAGAKMLVQSNGSISGTIGGGRIEAEAIKIALNVIKTGKTEKHQFCLSPDKELGMVCGGEMEIYVEPVKPDPVMYIFGAGHISLSLSQISTLLDFKIVVIDDRPDFANKERFPEADTVLVEDFANIFAKIGVDNNSYLIIVTRNHEHDQEVLEQAIKTPAKYIGMIGSKTKIKTLFNNLVDKGVDRKVLDRVYSPIGLEIYAETPEEIAISIIAEIIKVKRSPP
jgi:xanthine dehydrogenase accessory factor